MPKPPFTVQFGVMTPTIGQQLRSQNLKFNGEQIRYCEKLRECLTHLQFANLITDKQRKAALNKLFTKIKSHIK